MGIDAKLKEMGVCQGDTVILDDWELEWYEWMGHLGGRFFLDKMSIWGHIYKRIEGVMK